MKNLKVSNKIESEELRLKLPVKESYSVQNRITHDYGGIDLGIIELIIVYGVEFQFPNAMIMKSE